VSGKIILLFLITLFVCKCCRVSGRIATTGTHGAVGRAIQTEDEIPFRESILLDIEIKNLSRAHARLD